MDNSVILCEIFSLTRCYAYVNFEIFLSKIVLSFFLFSCIGLLDRFLHQSLTGISVGSSSSSSSSLITQKNLQLIAVATFLIAAKVEETHHPPVDELVYVTDHAYTSDQVKRMEKKILHDLRFELNRPTR